MIIIIVINIPSATTDDNVFSICSITNIITISFIACVVIDFVIIIVLIIIIISRVFLSPSLSWPREELRFAAWLERCRQQRERPSRCGRLQPDFCIVRRFVRLANNYRLVRLLSAEGLGNREVHSTFGGFSVLFCSEIDD